MPDRTDSWSIESAMDRGAYAYITKPIKIKDLKNEVRSAMANERV